jgi:MinD-like ATPase involved in chromosome partitioning or flagellar assembly
MVIPICVAKGGAGKSTLTLNLGVFLALRLREAGRKVCVVDANFQQADIGNLISVYNPNIATLAASQADLNPEGILRHVVYRTDLNTAFLLGPALTEEANPRWITPALYTAAIDALRSHYDYILVDSPVAEFHHDLFTDCLLPSADFMVVPVNPDWRAIHNTDRWLRAITASLHEGGQGFDPRRAGIVLNKASEDIACNEDQIRVELANWQWLGSVPDSRAWQKAANEEEVVATLNFPDLSSAFSRILWAVTGEEALNHDDAGDNRKRSAGLDGIKKIFSRGKK